jgi:hypothetical protein
MSSAVRSIFLIESDDTLGDDPNLAFHFFGAHIEVAAISPTALSNKRLRSSSVMALPSNRTMRIEPATS